MKIRKYLLIIILLLILANITCINAMDNDTCTAEIISQNLTDSNTNEQTNTPLQTNHKTSENLHQFEENDQLSAGPSPPDNNYWNNENGKIYHTQLTLTINDTATFNTTKNTTINLHLDWDLYMNQEYYNNCLIQIYENNTIIHTINISKQSNIEYEHNIHQTLDVTFPYTIKDKTELKAILLKIESNTLSFEEIKRINFTHLNRNTIIVNNNYFSNENWTNQLKYLKKAINEAPANSIIYLNNIEILNDEDLTIPIDKNITIIGNNTIINGLEHGTIFTISPQATVTLVNLTFTNTATNYIIQNNGNLKIINNNFNSNVGRIITNNGNLTLENSIIENTAKKYYAQSLNKMIMTSENGLIYNTKTLIIKNTTFNNIDLHPLTINGKKLDWTGIILNHDQTIITDCKFTNINYMTIYNNAILEINNTLMENITSTSIISHAVQYTNQINNTVKYFSYTKTASSIEGGTVYNNNQATITKVTFKKITGTNGGIYNNKNLNIINTTFQSINNGAIYNNGNQLTIENSLFDSASLNNKKYCQIYNSTITKSSISNEGEIIINNTTISKYNGLVVSNSGTMTITHSQIFNNNGDGNVILNNENGKFLLEKSIIKENTIKQKSAYGWLTYLGVIKNNGDMEITGCIFDNNQASDWDSFFGVMQSGSINIYNIGKLIVRYNYLINTQYYTLDEFHGSTSTVPIMFLLNAGGTSDVNYNFLCLDPNTVIKNTDPNYYFIPSFNDYIPVKLNENTNITLTLGLTNGVDKQDFNDWDKLLTPGLNATVKTIDENGEYINITTLLKDYYTFNFNYTSQKAIYTIYANILNYNNTAIVDIGKEFPEMTVTYNNITYNDGNNITFHVKVTGNLTVQPTGNVTFTYNDKKITVNLTDGKCNYTIAETLKPANYTMRIDYNGDEEYFKMLRQYYTFSVNKIRTNVTLSAPEIKIGETGKLTITITPGDAKLYGYLYYTTDRLHEANADTRGTRTLSLKNFPVGTHNLTVIFDEDEYYLGGTFTTFFTVSKYETQLNITASDVAPGKDNTTINITINPGDVRGDAIIKINNETQNIYINNTITPITLTNLKEGTYTVTVYYPGDSKYAPSNATTTFSVARITSKLNVQLTQNINLTGNIRIQTNPLNCTGEVAIYINNDRTILNLTDGTINTQIKFKRGTNYIYIHYNGDNTYSISSWNTTINIEGIPVLTLETQKLESGKTGYIRVNLTDTNNIPYEYTNITIEFQNTNTTITTNENGTAYLPINTQTGTYTIKATYQNATITKNITVKTLTQLKVNIQDINQADDLLVYATLTDSNGNKLNGEIVLEINGNYYKIIITNGAGSRNLGEFKAGTYTYTATYPENNILYSTNTTGSFKVNRDSYKITGNTDITQYYGSTKYYKIRLTNNNQPVKNEIITVTINKNTIKIKTDNQGYATLKLSLKAGKYTITATYKNVKASNKITVKPTLITKNKKIKKGKTLTYTAKLLNKNGKALKNKKITFKIKGKKYKAKTNKKGMAKIKVKNLKVGKYKIITTYGKQKNTNTITVKK